MDTQTANKMTERKRQRREFLKQKGEAYASMAASGGLILLSLALLALGFAAARRSHLEPVDNLIVGLFALALAGGCAWGVYWGVRDIRAIRRQANRIPYVPPVNTANLPPEEILVRSCEEPSRAAPEALLRPALGAEEAGTPVEEMLRIANNS